MDPKQVETARRHIRRFRKGVLRVDGEISPASFIIDGRDGRFVMPSAENLAGASNLVLYVPEDGFNDMAILLTATPHTDEFDEAKDRHLAYHGRAEGPSWFRCAVDSAKWGGVLYEGGALIGPNPLRSVEPRLCKRLNEDKIALAELSLLLTRVRPESPLCVGVDHLGMDVRTRIGIIRVEWPAEIHDEGEADRVIEALLKGAL